MAGVRRVAALLAAAALGMLLFPATASSQATIQIPVGADIQAVIDANPGPETFILSSGTHSGQSVRLYDNQTLEGEPGAILSGAETLTGWLYDNGRNAWYVGGQTQQGRVFPANVGSGDVCRPDSPRCIYPEELFIGGVRQKHVDSTGALGTGNWFFDYSANRIYLKNDPGGALVQTSVVGLGIYGGADNVTVRNLIVEMFATPTQVGAVDSRLNPADQFGTPENSPDGENWTVENVESRLNHGTGIFVTDGGQIKDSFAHHNGQQGVSARGLNLLIENNEISFNNEARHHWNFEGGGGKIFRTTDAIYRNNHVHDNIGSGIWFDIDNFDALIEGNLVENNESDGIFYEVSYGAVIRDNTVTGNAHNDPRGGQWVWGAGILIASSTDVEVYNNEVHDNYNSITGAEQQRGSYQGVPHEIENLYVHDNVISIDPSLLTSGSGFGNGRVGIGVDYPNPNCDSSFFSSRNNRFEENTYEIPAGANVFQWDCFNAGSWTNWQNQGNDLTGSLNDTDNFDMWDTCWRCITRANSDAELLTYLDYLQSAGFDGSWFWVVPAYWSQNDFVPPVGGGPNEPNWRGNVIGSLGSPNQAYLDDIKWFLDQMESRGLKAGVVPAWGADLTGTQPRAGEARAPTPAQAPLNETNAFAFGQALANTLGGHPSIEYWVLGGDWAFSITEQGSTTNYWQDEVDTETTWINFINGIRTGDTSTITYHTGPYDYSRDLFADRVWNEELGIHTSHCTTAADAQAELSERASYGKPVISVEMRYETWAPDWCPMHANDPIDEFDIEDDANAVLNSGAVGFVYGHQDRWRYESSAEFLGSLNSPGAARALAVANNSSPPGPGGPYDIDIHAAGDTGGEIMQLWINGSLISTWNVTNSPRANTAVYSVQDYPSAINNLQVHFTNNGGPPDRNLRVDKVVVNGTTYETEDPSVLGTAVQSGPTTYCDSGYFQQEVLFCNGYFEYQITTGPSPTALMFVGDSITEGTNSSGGNTGTLDNAYRGPFEALVNSAGHNIDFLGVRTTAPGSPAIGDPDHEGRGGATSDERHNEMLASGSYNLAPDYAFIHLGSNNIFDSNWNSATPDMPTQFQSDLEAMIDAFRAQNPNITIFVAQPIPCDLGTVCTDRLQQLRPRVTAAVNAKDSPGSPVIEVDQVTGFSIATDLKDGIHPNVTGRQKMAQAWFDALEPYLLGGPINEYQVHQPPRLQLGDAPLAGYSGSTTDQIEIMWQTKPGAGASGGSFDVEYRLVGAPAWQQATVPVQTVVGVEGRIDFATVITGLNYNANYEYRVTHNQDGNPVDTYQAIFKTRLAAGDTTAFSFVAYGDSANAVANSGFQSVQTAINSTDAEFALLLGDNAYENGTTAELDARFTPPLAPAAVTWNASHVDYLAIGHHDVANGTSNGEASEAAFSVPIPVTGVTAPASPPGSERAEHNYSFDYGDVHFVTFDSTSFTNETRLDAQLDWIDADLAADNSRWQVVFVHHPVAGAPNYPLIDPSDDYYQKVVSRLNAAGVDLFLAGHDHTYGRSFPLTGQAAGIATFVNDPDNDYEEGAGLVQVISARGGNNLRDGSYGGFPFMATGSSNADNPDPGFVKVDVGQSRLTINYTTSAGIVLDTFTISESLSDPVVSITAPVDAGVVVGSDVVVTWSTSDLNLGDHVHLTLDSDPHVIVMGTNTYTFTGVGVGEHTIKAEVASSGHVVYGNPEAIDIVSFERVAASGGVVTVGVSTAFHVSGANPLVLDVPVGTGVGDVLYAVVGTGNDKSTVAPVGWVKLDELITAASQDRGLVVFRRVVGASDPGSYSFGTTSNGEVSGFMVSLRGVDVSSPEDVSVVLGLVENSSAFDTGTISTVTDGALVLGGGFNLRSSVSPVSLTGGGVTKLGEINQGSNTALVFGEVVQPVAGTVGPFTTDFGPGNSDAAWFMIAVRPSVGNQSPSVDPITDPGAVVEGDSISVPVSATDPEGDDITLSLVDPPLFVTLIDNNDGTGMVSISPQSGDATGSPYLVQVKAAATGGEDTETFNVTVVESLSDPVVSITAPVDAGVVVGSDVVVTWSTSDLNLGDHVHLTLDSDPHVIVMGTNTYTFTGVGVGEHTIKAEVASSGHVVYGNPEAIDIVSFERVAASGGVVTVGVSTAFHVSGANPLVLDVPVGTGVGDVLYAVVGTGNDKSTVAPVGWVKLDELITAASQDRGLVVFRRVVGASDPGSYSFGTTSNGEVSGFMVSLRGVDVSSPEDVSVVLGLVENSSAFDTGTISTVTDGALVLGGGFNLRSSVSPVSLTGGGVTKLGEINQGSNTALVFGEVVQPVAGTVGPFTTDFGPGNSDAAWFMIAVRPIVGNQSPSVDPITDPGAVVEGDSISVPVSATDPEGDDITLSLVDPPLFVTLIDNNDGTGMVSISPQSGDATGSPYLVQVKAAATGGEDTETFNVTVVESLSDPVVSITAPVDAGVVVGSDVVVTWSTSDLNLGDHVHLTLDSDPHVIVMGTNTYTFTGVGVGEHTIKAEVASSGHVVYGNPEAIDIVSFERVAASGGVVTVGVSTAFHVSGANPLVLDVPVGTGVGDVLYAVVGTGNDKSTVAPVGWVKLDELITAASQDRGLVVFRRVVGASDPGSYSFGTTSNGEVSGFMVSLRGVDVSSPEDVSVVLGLVENSSAFDTGTISTVTDGALVLGGGFNLRSSVSPVSLTGGGVTKLGEINQGSNTALVFGEVVQPVAGTVGPFTTDFGPGNSDAAWFMIAVRPIVGNQSPSVDPITDPGAVVEGDSISVPVSATDPEGDDITLSLVDPPLFVTLIDNNDGTGMVSISPQSGDATGSPYLVQVKAAATGGEDTETFNVTVVESLSDPVVSITAPVDAGVVVGSDVVVTWSTSDLNLGDHVHLTLDSDPHVIVMGTNTYTFTGVGVGEHTIKAEVASSGHVVYGNPEAIDIVSFERVAASGGVVTVGVSTAFHVSGANPLVLDVPVGTGVGDVLYAVVGTGNDKSTVAPVGWVKLDELITAASQDRGLVVFRRVVGASDPGSYSFGTTSNGEVSGFMVSLRGVDVSSPEDVSVVLGLVENSSAFDTGTISTVTDGALVLGGGFNLRSSVSPVSLTGGGVTKLGEINQGSNTALVFGEVVQPVAGTVGPFTTDFGPGNSDAAWFMIAVRPIVGQ